MSFVRTVLRELKLIARKLLFLLREQWAPTCQTEGREESSGQTIRTERRRRSCQATEQESQQLAVPIVV